MAFKTLSHVDPGQDCPRRLHCPKGSSPRRRADFFVRDLRPVLHGIIFVGSEIGICFIDHLMFLWGFAEGILSDGPTQLGRYNPSFCPSHRS